MKICARIFEALHEKTALRGEWHREWSEPPVDPAVEAVFGERSTLFTLLVYLAALPYTEREYLRRGISPDIFQATMQDIRVWLVHEYELDGVWTFRQFKWIWIHLNCELFRLGRMQYMLAPFEWGVHAFRRRGAPGASEICLLANPNLPLRADGYALYAGRVQPNDPYYHPGGWLPPDPQTAWNAVFEPQAGAGGVTGFRPTARFRGRPPSYPTPNGSWSCRTAIPCSSCTFRARSPSPSKPAATRCARHLNSSKPISRAPFKATTCYTWFFTPQLQRLLPAESISCAFSASSA